MIHYFEFSNWHQLSGLRSDKYPNIVLHVTEYSCDDLVGTKISIHDTHADSVYFTGFVSLKMSTLFSAEASFTPEVMESCINAYGFNIRHTTPINVPDTVLSVLNGMMLMGYDYITLEYKQDIITPEIPEVVTDPYCYRKKSSKHVVVTKGLHSAAPKFILSNSPNFIWSDYEWMEPNVAYSISELVSKGTVPM